MLDSGLIEHFNDYSNVASAPEHECFDVASIAGAAQPWPRAAFGGVASRLPLYDRASINVGWYRDLGTGTYCFVNRQVDAIACAGEFAKVECRSNRDYRILTRDMVRLPHFRCNRGCIVYA